VVVFVLSVSYMIRALGLFHSVAEANCGGDDASGSE
jgi:hypothetical protein